MRGYDLEQAVQQFSLGDLAEDSDEEDDKRNNRRAASFEEDKAELGEQRSAQTAPPRSPDLGSNKEMRSPRQPSNR